MTVRENLIPDGLPYGERQGMRDALGAAGMPTETPRTPPAGATALTTAPGGPPVEETDMFDELTPQMGLLEAPQVDPQARIRQVRDSTPSAYVRHILTQVLSE